MHEFLYVRKNVPTLFTLCQIRETNCEQNLSFDRELIIENCGKAQ